MTADEYGYDPDKDYTVKDNEFCDGTDAAHPAWWRGEKHGSEAMVRLVGQWLDEPLEDLGKGFHQPSIQALRKRILELRAKHGF